MIHYAKLESSKRLQRVLALLKRGGWGTTREIDRLADVCAVSTAITELRRNGLNILCQPAGQGRYKYKLLA